MWRRRTILQGIRKGLAAQRPTVHPLLIQANQAFNQGDYRLATDLFGRLATGAKERGGQRAPIFELQTGRALIFDNKLDEGLTRIKNGINMFIAQNRIDEANNSFLRFKDELNGRKLVLQAQELEAWFSAVIIANNVNLHLSKTKITSQDRFVKKLLPVSCPNCGAAVNSQTVNWIDDQTAECEYCGAYFR